MEDRSKENTNKTKVAKLDLDSLLHPATAFAHPMDVVHDLDLTLNEKRAILASWASDACAIEAAPALRARAPDASSRGTRSWTLFACLMRKSKSKERLCRTTNGCLKEKDQTCLYEPRLASETATTKVVR